MRMAARSLNDSDNNEILLALLQVFFEGGYSEYEADLKRRTGNADPTRIKYRRMVLA